MRQSFLGLALAFAVPWAGCQAQQGTVPFVGCSADGQSGPIQPPKGQPKVVSLGEHPAGAIAYYKGEQAPGVFAPAGWHCRVWYGSSGSSILVTPTPIDTTHLVPPKVVAPAVEMGLRFAGTSEGSVWPATPRDYSQKCSPGLSRASRINTLCPILSSHLDDMHVTQ